MSYIVHFPQTTCTYRSYDTAMFYAIDYIVLKLYSIQEHLLSGKSKYDTYTKQYFYTIVDLLANKEYQKALEYNRFKLTYPYIVESTNYCLNTIKKSNYIIFDELINFANKLKKEVVFQ